MDEIRELEVMEIKCLWSMCRVTRVYRWSNEKMRRRVDVREQMNDRVDRKALEWFGHVERMSGERLSKRVYQAEVEGKSNRGRPCTN